MSSRKFLELMSQLPRWSWIFVRDHLSTVTGNTLGWITIILLHFAAIPTLLAVLLGESDKLPPVDLMLFLWAALISLFFKSLIEKNFMYISTICLGFVVQTVIMSLILFK